MVDIPGLPVPDAGPVFAFALLVHIAAGVTAVLAGLVAMLTRKGGAWHMGAGRVFLVGIVALFATMAVMTVIRWPATAHLAALGASALSAAALGWRNRRRGGSDGAHIAWMSLAYVAMLTAFYVDNGPHLPVWERLPDWSFWFLPAAVGAPLTIRAIRRHQGGSPASPAVRGRSET
ncbi:hypothetical protein [Isoptericola cucumis]|uniref:DUF2306 domain-containing protein n=1 Tax=Isoptericola cucumis TaxID=1776856 RepID=A0ABQ2B3R6_9MICO|nr:hypothetical protein [Isoptericola cucumis]GGI07276.1 hypothetical protein GCM10007368_15360 [Isoptericola cucumis]